MRSVVAAVAAVAAAVTFAGGAAAGSGVVIGINDDAGKYEDGGSRFFSTMNGLGFAENTMTVLWDETRPTQIVELGWLEHAVPVAQAQGLNVNFDIYPVHSQALTNGGPAAITQFAQFALNVMQSFPTVTTATVMNECNQPRFVNPQFDASGKNISAAICGQALAQAYDLIKAYNASIRIFGVGLSPRGNDNPSAPNNVSTSPVRFLQYLGEWYRESGRTAPLMDDLDFHPYPNYNTDPFEKGYQWPNASVVNMPRIYQAFWDAFNGTGQRVIGQGATTKLNELGVQTGTGGRAGYSGAENAPGGPVTEAAQAEWYRKALDYAACDPNISGVNLFHGIDETALEAWQSGLFFVDWGTKSSADPVRAAIAAAKAGCQGGQKSWSPTTKVIGTRTITRTPDLVPAANRYWAFSAYAEEDANYTAWIANRSGKRIATTTGTVQAYFTPLVKFPPVALACGSYTFGITFSADTNPTRKTTLAVDRFKVVGACASAAKPKAKGKAARKKKRR